MKRILPLLICIVLLLSTVVAENLHPFTDVSKNAYYYDAVEWAAFNGITNGTSESTFSPDRPITRAEAVTMLWRMAGRPSVSDPPEELIQPTPSPTPYEEKFGDAGRLYLTDLFSVALYTSGNGKTSQDIVDEEDSAWTYSGWGNTVIGDHFDDGFYRIRLLQPGDTCYILQEDGSRANYECVRIDKNGTNTGGDVLDSNGNSAFDDPDSDMFMYTCNPAGGGKSVTIVYWINVMDEGAQPRTYISEEKELPYTNCDCTQCNNAKIINPEVCKTCLESQINESTMKLAQEIQNNFIFMKENLTNGLFQLHEL